MNHSHSKHRSVSPSSPKREVTPEIHPSRSPPPTGTGRWKPKKPKVRILRELPEELARLAPLYLSRHSAHPALAPYPTLDSLVATLTLYTPESKPERLALIGSLIDLHRDSGHRLWSTLLLRVFRPMLNNIRGALEGGVAEELDAALVSSFLEALRVVDTKASPLVAKLVRWRTRRFFFRRLKGDTRWEEIGFGVEGDTAPDPATEVDPMLIAVWLREERQDDDSVELIRTLFDRGVLWTLVRRRYAARSSQEQLHEYRRLQGRRRRLVQRFRRRLRHEVGESRQSTVVTSAEVESVVDETAAAATPLQIVWKEGP
jgi:hypothetical protein